MLAQGPPREQLALPLLVLLAQQRRLLALDPPSPHLKLVAELYDKCAETLAQYSTFLRTSLPQAEYAALLPSLQASQGVGELPSE